MTYKEPVAIASVTGLQTSLDAKQAVATTLAGYGITDAYTKTAADALLATKASTTTIVAAYVNTTVPAGNTVADTASETAFASSKTFAGGSLVVGSVVRVTMYGVYSTALIAPTLRGKLKLGSTTVLDTGALTTVAGVTNAGWSAFAMFVVTAVGAGGTVEAQGFAQFATAATTGLSVNIANTAAVSIDLSASQALTTTVQWSAGSASNTISLRECLIEVLPGTAL